VTADPPPDPRAREAAAPFGLATKVAAVASLTLLVALVVALGVYRVHYTSWPWQGEPYRLHYCGREYERFSDYPRGTPIVARPAGYRRAFRTPPVIGREVLVWATTHCGVGVVPTGILRSVGHGRYRVYGLLGGP
jgi:hypothetical protein